MDLEFLHFEQLKKEIQAQYLKNHTPSYDDISKWKGIDIIYFQEDLRKIAKGNISEKSFYTYFKSSTINKLPRIDMLNLLSLYAGYASWFEFKKQHKETEGFIEEVQNRSKNKTENTAITSPKQEQKAPNTPEKNLIQESVLQKSDIENQRNNQKESLTQHRNKRHRAKEYAWIGLSVILAVCATLLGFKDLIFGRTFTYCFTDADRSSGVLSTIEVKVFKQDESPLIYKIKPGDCFIYHTKDKNLVMQITSPFYENLKVTRNLENAPKEENIDLKPDDYKFAFYYFSRKDISGNTAEDLISQKRKELENRISDDAIIKQIYDSDIYGVETISKEKYITLVTTPTTSLKNLNLLEMKRNEKGKIISIKFKITDNEKN